jgi:hypothetical protein
VTGSKPWDWISRFYRLKGTYLAEEVIGVAPEWVHQLLRRLAIYGEARSPLEVARGLNDEVQARIQRAR